MSISMTSLYISPIMDTSSDCKSGFYSKKFAKLTSLLTSPTGWNMPRPNDTSTPIQMTLFESKLIFIDGIS